MFADTVAVMTVMWLSKPACQRVLLPSLPQAVRQRSEEQKDMVFVGERWISLDELKRQLTLARKEICMKLNH